MISFVAAKEFLIDKVTDKVTDIAKINLTIRETRKLVNSMYKSLNNEKYFK